MTTTVTKKPRPRGSLPLAPLAAPAKRGLRILDNARDEDRKWKPTYAVWEVTLKCDLACRHCGSRAGRARPDELTTDECLDLVKQMAELGTKEVTIIGGEAYLREDWLEIVKAIRAHGMTSTMTSGGRGLTLERAKAGKAAGLQSVSISVDGLRELHDDLRGVAGSFDSAFEAMRNLKQAGLPFSSNTQVTRPGLKHVPAVFDKLVEAGIHSWQVQITVAMGRAVDWPELLLEPYQMIEVLSMLHRLKAVADKAGVRMWPGNNIGYFGPYESELRGHLPRGYMWSCGAGRSTLGIEANGDIKGCPSLPSADYVGGNIRDASLEKIWQGAEALRFTRDRTVEDLWGFCRTCYYADTCRAGCSWTSHTLFGKPGNNPFCHHRNLELMQIGKRERIVRVAAAPNEPFDCGKWELVVEEWPADELAAARELARTGEGWIK